MDNKLDITTSKPTDIWNRPLQFNFKELCIAFTKTASAILLSEWVNVAEGMVDVTASIGLTSAIPGEAAWLLIYRSLLQANLKIAYYHSTLVYQ